MKPRISFQTRPKKTGAKKRTRVKAQKKRLVERGLDKNKLDKMTVVQIRKLLRDTAKRRAVRKRAKSA